MEHTKTKRFMKLAKSYLAEDDKRSNRKILEDLQHARIVAIVEGRVWLTREQIDEIIEAINR